MGHGANNHLSIVVIWLEGKVQVLGLTRVFWILLTQESGNSDSEVDDGKAPAFGKKRERWGTPGVLELYQGSCPSEVPLSCPPLTILTFLPGQLPSWAGSRQYGGFVRLCL